LLESVVSDPKPSVSVSELLGSGCIFAAEGEVDSSIASIFGSASVSFWPQPARANKPTTARVVTDHGLLKRIGYSSFTVQGVRDLAYEWSTLAAAASSR